MSENNKDIEAFEQDDQQELFEHYRFECDKGQSPFRVDKFLFNKIMNASRSKIQAAAAAGNILVNEKPVKANYKVKPGDIIQVVMEYPPREIEIIPQDIPLDIVYEDDHLLVVNKQPGLVVHPGHGNYSGTLVNALAHHLRDLDMFNGGDPRPGLVHRIDKDTSGLLVIAKTELAKNKLAKQFFDKSTKRRYKALVWGVVDDEEGTVTGHVGRSLKDRLQMDVFPDGDFGKHAVTHYRVVERIGYVTFIECQLETGRTHQIRAHMKHIGHVLFNDARYGGNEILKGTTFTKYKQFVNNCFEICPRQVLHAETLGFVHPHTNEFMEFKAPIPADISNLLDKWRHYVAYRKEDE